MGSIHQLIKFIPKLSSLLDTIRQLLNEGKENIIMNTKKWNTHNAEALDKIKSQIVKITEQRHIDKKVPHR